MSAQRQKLKSTAELARVLGADGDIAVLVEQIYPGGTASIRAARDELYLRIVAYQSRLRCPADAQRARRAMRAAKRLAWFAAMYGWSPAEEREERERGVVCAVCKSSGFPASQTGTGCTFCDGSESGNPPEITQ